MTRINALRNTEIRSVAWGKPTNAGVLIFAAVLVVCSVTVGCSSDKPKTVSASTRISAPSAPAAMLPAPVEQAAATNPAPRKVVHKKPATVNYTDKSSGLTFEYPHRYAIETGTAASDVLASSPVPMNFVQPGGVALATVELPETGFANTDFSSAFFNVSLHKTLTAEQCNEFAVPQPKVVTPAVSSETATTITASTPSTEPAPAAATIAPSTDAKSESKPEPSSDAKVSDAKVEPTPAAPAPSAQPEPQGSRLMLGDLELRATEAVAGEGSRQSDSKYFHVYQNGACYEFGLNVTTVASDQGVTKHVNRDQVFSRLEKILSTVKINPVAAPEVTAEAPAAPVNPAQ
jgi:hypothetical protein